MKEKILIIGAGASGLTAANSLAERGYDITVVEARDRIGGRIDTLENYFSIPVERGAEFMHGRQPDTLSLLQHSNSSAKLLSGNRYQLWKGQLHQGDFFDGQWDLLMQALGELRTDVDMAAFLNRNFSSEKYDVLRQKISAFVEGYDAADLHQVSALGLKKEWAETDDAHQYHIHGGYMRLMHYLAGKIKSRGGEIFLSSPVREIAWSEGRVKITTGAGTIVTGEKVIVTVPLGVLKRGDVHFSPPLHAHAKAFDQMGFGGVIKIFFEFNHAFWEENARRPFKDVSFIFSDAEVPTWWSPLPDKTPLLTGWLGGPSTFTIPDDPELLYDRSLRALEYIFNLPQTEIRRAVRKWNSVNWVAEPFTWGAYAYPAIGYSAATNFISVPVKNTLYFAGEALHEGTAIGTVEAALASGMNVAQKIAF